MRKKLLVSCIITTRNEEMNLKNLLESIKKQSYKDIEIIVVDNNSIDKTKQIAKQYTQCVFNRGPERSAQRNFGAQKAKGEYVIFLDADMVLSSKALNNCVTTIEKMHTGGIIIPEKSFGTSWWAKAKALERSFYVGNDAIEAARFYRKAIFKNLGGFDESLTGPEDWDLSQRVKEKYGLGRIQDLILHNEGNLSLLSTVKKKYYYARKMKIYIQKNKKKNEVGLQVNILQRYWIFLSKPEKLFNNPILGISVLLMKTIEFGAGALAMISTD